jgi:hypothetical protein
MQHSPATLHMVLNQAEKEYEKLLNIYLDFSDQEKQENFPIKDELDEISKLIKKIKEKFYKGTLDYEADIQELEDRINGLDLLDNEPLGSFQFA